MTDQPTIRPGQTWADNDKRSEGRTLRVDTIIEDRDGSPYSVKCTVLTNSNEVQASLDTHPGSYQDARGKTTHIRIARMCPTSTGYRLVRDA